MNIAIRFHQLEQSRALKLHAIEQVRSQLARFASMITGVTVRFGDVNGPKGGADKECRILVRLRGSGSAAVGELQPSAYQSVNRAAERMAQAIERQLARTRRPRSLRHTLRGPSGLGYVG